MLETGGLGLRSRVIFPDGFLRYGRGRGSRFPSREQTGARYGAQAADSMGRAGVGGGSSLTRNE